MRCTFTHAPIYVLYLPTMALLYPCSESMSAHACCWGPASESRTSRQRRKYQLSDFLIFIFKCMRWTVSISVPTVIVSVCVRACKCFDMFKFINYTAILRFYRMHILVLGVEGVLPEFVRLKRMEFHIELLLHIYTNTFRCLWSTRAKSVNTAITSL